MSTIDFDICELGIKLEIDYTCEITPEPRTDTLDGQGTIIEDRYEINIFEIRIGGKHVIVRSDLLPILYDKLEDYLRENPQ